ncbi:MAG: RluA family pseudouridine synthase [Clostridia bacterium]|jgi:23S rRNA pseudouridine1911/1915/1917 synthase
MGEHLKILFEDNHIIVIEKKPDQPVMQDSSNDYDLLTQIKDYIKIKYDKPGNVYVGLVHRLDRPVGGVMVFAKTSKAASRLSESIRNNEFKKKYLAVVLGRMKNKNAVLENWMYKDEVKKISFISDEKNSDSKLARLSYTVLKTSGEYSLLDIDLSTGRHHQIRVQLANIGHPIYGDMKYGSGPKGHIALFAYNLTFAHPVSKEELSFTCEPDYSIPPWPLFR